MSQKEQINQAEKNLFHVYNRFLANLPKVKGTDIACHADRNSLIRID